MINLRRIRKQRGISIRELASIVGVNAMSIYRYEQGDRTPTVDIAAKLAAALECSIDELIGKAG